ncbi:Hypothetical protein CINCED_3A012535 [Cinara cedri]|uniref:Uncharacterized protein n=1 Tax=Cinara cedri TaxID=506608 RepID=A0A5E4N351_9HEMI|nr:Hypothetical protein CINCED_3A012535 [Cinara cedri]
MLVWISSPYVLSKTIVTIKNLDGSYAKYRMNIFNLYFIASDETYNKYFNVFYLIEITVAICFTYFSVVFDIVVITICVTISCQLDAIGDAFQSLGHKNPVRNNPNFNNVKITEHKFNAYDNLKIIIMDHQNKDSIIFALYSSNWTDMDVKTKKLILLAMKMNNANQLKMKFTNTKVVNLEMYSNVSMPCSMHIINTIALVIFRTNYFK